ncbi:flagellar hook assembly protein FlgD [Halalkalibacter urbisdiaboli]|uniref:flagellar hook assembly protein FlgD n=1 Tax=Halalkalibacter urbisdiaboli TaxID=1960589 RepID=UPI000B44CFDE|nr:flagellar hook assembly protein FlgD [Halalkalibacter urbisdiaboli]
MTTINEGLYLNSKPTTDQQSSNNILGKDDFLKILITQLQNQDPSNPMDDREFIAQMATFSSLEQMTNMNQSIQKFVNFQMSQNLLQHSELIGKKVQWTREVQIDEFRTKTEEATNHVTSVKLEKDGTLRVLLDNGRWITNNQVVQISLPDSPNSEDTANGGSGATE